MEFLLLENRMGKEWAEQFDVSSEMKKLYDLKQKQRATAKEYYMNFLYNPHRPVNDGMPFDPALQRFSAMSSYFFEHFKPKGAHWGRMFAYLTPFIVTFITLRIYKNRQEDILRSGKVAYSDRRFKLIM